MLVLDEADEMLNKGEADWVQVTSCAGPWMDLTEGNDPMNPDPAVSHVTGVSSPLRSSAQVSRNKFTMCTGTCLQPPRWF